MQDSVFRVETEAKHTKLLAQTEKQAVEFVGNRSKVVALLLFVGKDFLLCETGELISIKTGKKVIE